MTHYLNIQWKKGIPVGINPIDPKSPRSYKIVKDPYRKRFSVEKYCEGTFDAIVYDSALFDFRKLVDPEQKVWQQTATSSGTHIRDENDRLILIEKYSFENAFCKEARLFSPHGIPIAVQKMYDKAFGDPYDGSVLFDLEGQPIFWRTFEEGKVNQGWGALYTERESKNGF